MDQQNLRARLQLCRRKNWSKLALETRVDDLRSAQKDVRKRIGPPVVRKRRKCRFQHGSAEWMRRSGHCAQRIAGAKRGSHDGQRESRNAPAQVLTGGDDIGRVVEIGRLAFSEAIEIERQHMKAAVSQEFGMASLQPESLRSGSHGMGQNNCAFGGSTARGAENSSQAGAICARKSDAFPVGFGDLFGPAPRSLKSAKK